MKKKKLLLLSDNLTQFSGVGRMARNIVKHLVKEYDVVQLAGSGKTNDEGKIFDLSKDFNKEVGITDASVVLYPVNGYGNRTILSMVLAKEKPDVLMHFTDPRYWEWLYNMEDEIRKTCPITYYHVWDNMPIPHYNAPYYLSCDSVMSISKLTQECVRGAVNGQISDVFTPYIPHGIDTKYFYPITEKDYNLNPIPVDDFVNKHIGNSPDGSPYEFIYLYNNRNLARKNVTTLIESYFNTVDKLSDKEANSTLLLLKTQPNDKAGCDLYSVVDVFKKTITDKANVKFITDYLSDEELNIMYNVSSVTMNIAAQEGWGLSSTESMMTGTPIINNITGGLQDQMYFTNNDGNHVSVLSNNLDEDGYVFVHNGESTKDNLEHGEWAFPIFPATKTIIGNQKTPYIYDDRVNVDQLALLMHDVRTFYSPDELYDRGMKGHEFAMKHYTNEHMSEAIKQQLDMLIDTWKPNNDIVVKSY